MKKQVQSNVGQLLVYLSEYFLLFFSFLLILI